MKKWLLRLVSFLLVFGLILSLFVRDSLASKNSEVAYGNKGMVVSPHPEASKIGAKVLREGGNAVDAAIAMQFALNVVEPMMSGIGGGGFMMVYDARTKKTSIIESREKAPQGAKSDMFLDENGNVIPFAQRSTHGNAVGVPGTLKGLYAAHDKWGSKPFNRLIRPSIRLAEDGVKVNWVLAEAIKNNQNKLLRSSAKDIFFRDEEPLKEGDLLVQKDLAKTFRLIQKYGAGVFYRGKIGRAIAETVQQYGGSMTLKDLKNYHYVERKPLFSDYQGYKIATMPPPSSGGLTALQILKMLEKVDISQYDVRSPEKYHLLTEAMHLAYADRGEYIGDSDFVDVPKKGLLHPEYIEERSDLIDISKVNTDVQPGEPWNYEDSFTSDKSGNEDEDKVIGETTHYTVADKWGNIVSFTTTIEQLFGTGIMVPGYGIMLNNELTDFDAVPGGPNEVEPNKRPMSSMTPTIVFKDDKPFMTVGSPGGATIIASVAQVLLNVIHYDMDLKDAIEEPRIYSNKYPSIRWEKGIPEETRLQLEQMGHKWENTPVEIGNVNALIIRDDGSYYGAADSSREGSSIGIK